MDIREIKLFGGLPIHDTSKDDELVTLSKAYAEVASDYCNQKFDIDKLPLGVKKFIAESIKFGASGNLASRSMGTVSYSFVTELPKATYDYLKPYRKLRWRGYDL